MRRLPVLLATCLSLHLAGSLAQADEPSARDIVKRASESGAPDAIRETVTMTLEAAKGAPSTRALTIVRKKTASKSGAKTWNTRIEFLSPKDVAGTVLLTLEKASGSADQYLYLPGLKRVRRIGGSQKSGSFQGSDFAYEDLGARDLEAADYELLADETIGADACWQIRATPKKDADTGYGRSLLDIRKSDALTLRIRYFDPKGAALKILDIDPAKLKVDGDTRIPLRLEMKTLVDGHRTTLDITAVDLHPTLDDALFDAASLDKG